MIENITNKLSIANDENSEINNISDELSKYKTNRISELVVTEENLYEILLKNNDKNEKIKIMHNISIWNAEESGNTDVDSNTIKLLLGIVFENELYKNTFNIENFKSLFNLDNILNIYNEKFKNKKHINIDKEYFKNLKIQSQLYENGIVDFNKILTNKKIISTHNNNIFPILTSFDFSDDVNYNYFKQRIYEKLISGHKKDVFYIITELLVKNHEHYLDLDKKILLQNIIDEQDDDKKRQNIFTTLFENIKTSFVLKDKNLLNKTLDLANENSYSISELLSDKTMIKIILNNYDEELFYLLYDKSDLDTDLTIFNFDEHHEEASLFQIALSLKQYHILPSLMKLGYTITMEEINLNLQYYSDIDYMHFINLNIIDENTKVESNEEKTSEINILFYLLNMCFYESFFLLINNIKNKNPNFSISNIKENNKILFISFLKNISSLKFDIDEFKTSEYTTPYYQRIIDCFVCDGVMQYLPYKFEIINILKENIPDNLQLVAYVVSKIDMIFSDFEKEQGDLSSLINDYDTLYSWINIEKLKQIYLEKKEKTKSDDCSNLSLLENIINKEEIKKPKLKVINENIFNELKIEFPNFHEVIDFYQAQFRLNTITGKNRVTPILLLGEAGIGKTLFAKTLAEKLNTGYSFIDIASCTASWVFTGNNGTWHSAKQGLILDAMLSSETLSPVILMDEIDKNNSQRQYDPINVLYQLLEEVNAKNFKDEYLDFEFDASNIIYIACANSVTTLSEPLLSRFKVFEIQKPTPEQFSKIMKSIYKTTINNSHLFEENLSDEIIEDLQMVNNIREAKNMIEVAIGNALLEIDPNNLEQIPIVIEKKHLSQSINKKPFGFH